MSTTTPFICRDCKSELDYQKHGVTWAYCHTCAAINRVVCKACFPQHANVHDIAWEKGHDPYHGLPKHWPALSEWLGYDPFEN
jgi:hypothetical protein